MISFAISFALGVWHLQQQAVLPDLPSYWPLTVLALLLPRPERFLLRLVRHSIVLLCAATLGYGYTAAMARHRLSDQLPNEWQGRNIVVTGIVAEMPRQHERGLRFAFDVEKVLTEGASVPQRILLGTYGGSQSTLRPAAGERWQLTVRLKQPHGSSNPGSFDFEVWALERNIRAVGYVYEKGTHLKLADSSLSPAYLVQHLRESVREHFRRTLGDAPYTGILTALAIGDQAGIGNDAWQLFTRTGTNHLMSISGLHITLLAGVIFGSVYWLWQCSVRLTLLFPARKAAAVASLAAALFYALVSGYEVPAQRTLYMVAAFTVTLLLSRNISPSQMLAVALLVVLLADPWAVLSPGFWLSFGAVALIFYVTANRLHLQHWLKEYGKVQWAMTIGLIPPLLAWFQQLSLVAPLANAFAIPLISLLVVPLVLLGTLPPLEWMLYLAHQTMALCLFLLRALDDLPFAVWLQHTPPAWAVVMGMMGALWLLAPRGFPMRGLGLLLLLPMFTLPAPRPEYGTARITVFDVGQGLAVSVQTRQHALLYDTGPDFSGDADSGNRILVPALRSMGITRLDMLVLSHDDIDHTGGTDSLLGMMPVSHVLTALAPGHPRLALAPHYAPCHDGQSWEWEGVQFEILHPAREAHQDFRDNNQSCVLRVSAGGQSLLLVGDIEHTAEQRLLAMHADKLPATLLIAPHHGSRSASSPPFVNAVRPRHVVFTVGYRNRFGHPHKEVVTYYRAVGSTVLRTDEVGAIQATLGDGAMQPVGYRNIHPRYWHHRTGMPAA